MVALIALQPDMAHRVLRGDQPNSSDDYDFLSPRLSRRRERTFLHFQWNAGVWKTGVQEPALLLDRRREYANPIDSSQNLAIIAVARIFGRRRDSSHYETRPIEVSNWTLLSTPIPLHLVTEQMEPRSSERIWGLLDVPPRPLPGWLSSELEEALARFIPDYNQLLQDKGQAAQSNEPNDIEAALRDAERRDRYGTALRIFGGPEADARVSTLASTTVPEHAQRLKSILTEKAMLTDDSQRMPGWRPSGPSVGGWFEYFNAGRRLLIRDIDREREKESGSDLIYVRESPATIILVQYKRLTLSKAKLSYRDPKRLHSQLLRIISFEEDSKAAPPANNTGVDSYRLSEISGFVKFVETRPLKGETDDPLHGYYYPARYYYEILDPLAKADKLASSAIFTPERYIDTQTFIRLVSGGWIGSRSSASLELADKLGALLRDTASGETTIAVEHQDDDHQQ
jgi:hypothetical protein